MPENTKIPTDFSRLRCLVIGGSAGAVGVIYSLLAAMPHDFPLPVIIVLHRGKQFRSSLGELLQLRTAMRIHEAAEKEKLLPGNAYLAPANFHLLIEPDETLTMDDSEPVMYCRPAIDISFYSAADVYGKGLAAVLLSGANADGADGCGYAEKKGGVIIVQDPAEAEVDTMPRAGLTKVKHALILNTDGIIQFVEQVVQSRKKPL